MHKETMMRVLEITALMSILISAVLTANGFLAASEKQLVVILTFSYLKPDVERLLCGATVSTLVLPGIDPHQYQLGPSDVGLLKKADLIISTGHTSFEMKINELAKSKEINARVIDITNIPGIRFSTDPVTGRANYHMPLNDPINYLAFINYLLRVLVEIDHERANCYYLRYLEVSEKLIREVLPYRHELNGKVIIDKPHAQYLVEWLGLEVLWTIKPEEEYQVTPNDLDKIRNLVNSGSVKAVIVTRPGNDPASSLLLEIADESSIPIIWVSNPASVDGIYDSLLDLLNQTVALKQRVAVTEESKEPLNVSIASIRFTAMLVAASFVAGLFIGIFVKRTFPKG